MNNYRKEILLKLRQTIYYWIIFLVSAVVLIFMPMIGSEAGLEFRIPNTSAGWMVYIVTKVLVALLNVVIFFSFMQQAKLNVRDDEKFKEANQILERVKSDKAYVPRDPKKWETKQYVNKGTTIFLSTSISLIALTNALLTYDYMQLLVYSLTIIMGIVFGLLQMTSAEDYWTREYWDYAKLIESRKKEGEKENGINS